MSVAPSCLLVLGLVSIAVLAFSALVVGAGAGAGADHRIWQESVGGQGVRRQLQEASFMDSFLGGFVSPGSFGTKYGDVLNQRAAAEESAATGSRRRRRALRGGESGSRSDRALASTSGYKQAFGADFESSIPCNYIPLGPDTTYSYLPVSDWAGLLLDTFGDALAEFIPWVGEQVDLPVAPAGCFELGDQCYSDRNCNCDEAVHVCKDSGTLDENDNPVLTCQERAPGDSPLYSVFPFCVVWNENMFGISFFPAIPPIIPFQDDLGIPVVMCSVINGIQIATLPAQGLSVFVKFRGVGVSYGSGDNLGWGYGVTTQSTSVSPPTIYDGLTEVPLTVPEVDFWLSLVFIFRPTPLALANIAKCQGGVPTATEFIHKVKLEMDTELYIKADATEGCVLLSVTQAILKISVVPAFDMGFALGGYCRKPDDLCVPDGFFINVAISPKIKFLQGPLDKLLSYAESETSADNPTAINFEETSLGSAGFSLGFFLDKGTGNPNGALVRILIQGPKIFGIPLFPSLHVEFQYLTRAELERRRYTITREKGEESGAHCPATFTDAKCPTWKDYLKSDGEPYDPPLEICATMLEDKDPLTGVGPFNRVLLAEPPGGTTALKALGRDPKPDQWQQNDRFTGSDIVVLYFGAGQMIFGFWPLSVTLDSISLTIVLFGDFGSDPEYPEGIALTAEQQQELDDAAATNDALGFYIEFSVDITVSVIAEMGATVTVGNYADRSAPSPADTFDLYAAVEFDLLGFHTDAAVTAEWTQASSGRRLSRLADRDEVEQFSRSLASSASTLDDVSLDYSSVVTCTFCEAIGEWVMGAISDIGDALIEAGEALIAVGEAIYGELKKVAEKALALVDGIADAFDDLSTNFTNALKVVEEKFAAASAKGGITPLDLVNLGIALIEGVADAIVTFFEDIGKAIAALFAETRGKTTIPYTCSAISFALFPYSQCDQFQVGEEPYDSPSGCSFKVETWQVCDAYLFGWCASGWRTVQGAPFVDSACLELAASDFATSKQLAQDAQAVGDEQTYEKTQANMGYYGEVGKTCTDGTTSFRECEVANVNLLVNTVTTSPGNRRGRRLEGSSGGSFSLSGSALQAASPTALQTSGNYDAPEFDSEKCDVDAANVETVTTDDGKKICKAAYEKMVSFETQAKALAATLAQGDTEGLDSQATQKYLVEINYNSPVLRFRGASESDRTRSMEKDCTDPAMLTAEGVPAKDNVQDLAAIYRVLKASPPPFPMEVVVDSRLKDQDVKYTWAVESILKSCELDTYRLSVFTTDSNKKQSEKLFFEFGIRIVTPSLVAPPGAPDSVTLGCADPRDINPYLATGPPILPPPTFEGGCMDADVVSLEYADEVVQNFDTEACSGYTIVRTWSLSFPNSAGDVTDGCAAHLLETVPAYTQTFRLDPGCDRPLSFVAPQECLASRYRLTDQSDYATVGFLALDLMPKGASSLQGQELLLDADSVLHGISEYDVASGTSKPAQNCQVLSASDSFSAPVSGGDLKYFTTALDGVFLSHGQSIGHRTVQKYAQHEYGALCGQVIGLKVQCDNGEADFVCFEATCGVANRTRRGRRLAQARANRRKSLRNLEQSNRDELREERGRRLSAARDIKEDMRREREANFRRHRARKLLQH